MTITCIGSDVEGHSYHFGMPPTNWKLPKGYMIKMARYPGEFAEVVSNLKAEPWMGEGLPPVGTVCETVCGGIIRKVEVLALTDTNILVRDIGGLEDGREWLHCHTSPGSRTWRPIRTPEQIAADERETALAEMVKIAKDQGPSSNQYQDMGAIYDAGYRKQVAK